MLSESYTVCVEHRPEGFHAKFRVCAVVDHAASRIMGMVTPTRKTHNEVIADLRIFRVTELPEEHREGFAKAIREALGHLPPAELVDLDGSWA